MADLPSEVITEILSRLPVKSLLRLRCTCKWWRSLIDSTYFVFFHLNKSSESNIILRQHSGLYLADLDAVDRVEELNNPLMCYNNRVEVRVIGSCYGLLCICNNADDIVFWNPSIRKHRILPAAKPLNLKENNDNNSNTNTNTNTNTTLYFLARIYGFGYDSISDDYKLVSISYFADLSARNFDSQVKLYTMRTDAWKSLPSMPYALGLKRNKMGVFVGGALHWVFIRKLERDQPNLVVAFDLRFEIFREVLPPVTVNGKFKMDVALLGGCLCVIENRRNEGFDVWVMREYGLGDSWCKLFSVFSVEQPRPHDMRYIECLKPLAYSRNGDKVLLGLNNSKLCWYNLINRDVSWISGMPKYPEGTVCLESLVPPTLLS